MDDESLMREAVRLAREGMKLGDGGPFGALIVREGEIVAHAWNRVVADTDPTAHAEVVAIRRATAKLGRFHLDDCELFTSCEPCPMCLGAAYWAHIGRICYAATAADAEEIGFSDAFILRQLRLPPGDREIPFQNLLRDDGRAVMAEFAATADQVEY